MDYQILTDDSLMPFGKYKGIQMQDVPVQYLHWYWHNCDKKTSLGEYIKDNLDALKMENKDLIWT